MEGVTHFPEQSHLLSVVSSISHKDESPSLLWIHRNKQVNKKNRERARNNNYFRVMTLQKAVWKTRSMQGWIPDWCLSLLLLCSIISQCWKPTILSSCRTLSLSAWFTTYTFNITTNWQKEAVLSPSWVFMKRQVVPHRVGFYLYVIYSNPSSSNGSNSHSYNERIRWSSTCKL